MRLQDITGPDLMVSSIKSKDLSEAVAELLRTLSWSRRIDEHSLESIGSEILRRQASHSCGLGRRLAFPNARIRGLLNPVLAVGLSHPGIDVQAPDDQRANVILLYVGSAEPSEEERRLLRHLSSALANDRAVSLLLSASSAADAWKAIRFIDDLCQEPSPRSTGD